MSDSDLPDLVESSDEDITDSETSLTGLDYAEKWLKKGDKYLEKQELWMRVFSLSPFLFGCSVISAAWIKALINAKLLQNDKRQTERTFLSWPEWEYLDLVDYVVTEVQANFRNRNNLAQSLECVSKLDKCTVGVVIDVDLAIEEASKVLEITDLWRRILKHELSSGKEKAAKFAVLYIIRIYREHVIYLCEKPVDFIDHAKSMVKSKPDAHKIAEEHKKKGNEHFRHNNFEEAVNEYSYAADADHFNHVYYGNRAQAYIQLKQYREALADGRRAVVIKPDFPKGHYRYAIAFHGLGQLETAIRVNQKGLILCQKSPSQDYQNIKELEAQGTNFFEEKTRQSKGLTSIPKDLEDKLATFPNSDTDLGEKLGCKLPNNDRARDVDAPPMVSSTDSDSHTEHKKIKQKKKSKTKTQNSQKQEKKEPEKATESVEEMKPVNKKAEFMACLRDGSDSIVKTLYKEAMVSYQKCLDLLAQQENPQMFGLDETDRLTLKYAFSIAAIDTKVHKNIMEGIEMLEEIKHYVENHDHINFPVIYYALGKAYIIMNRFPQAIEPLQDGYQVASSVTYTQVTWPGTKHIIKETRQDILQERLREMLQQCRCPPPPDAVCRYHSDPSDKRTVIYLSDPDFKGYIQIICQNSCAITFHTVCWKTYKNAENKVGDKDILDTKCPTPDCVGFIIRIHIVRSDSITEKEYISEKYTELKENNKNKKPVAKQKTTNESKIARRQEKKDKRKKKKFENSMELDAGRKKRHEDEDDLITDGASAMAFIADIESETQPLPDVKDTIVLKKDNIEVQKPAKSRKGKRKGKGKDKQILNVEVNFSDRKEETLLNENSILSDEEKENKMKSQQNPFTVPTNLKSEINNFEKSYANSAKPLSKPDEITENLFSYFVEILKANGPLAVDDTRVQQELEVFPQEALEKIKLVGGLADFLRQSLKFAVIDDVISLMSDAKRAREIALIRRQDRQNTGHEKDVPNAWKTVGKTVNNIDGLSESVKTSTILPVLTSNSNLSSVNSNVLSQSSTVGFMTNSNNSNSVSSFGNLPSYSSTAAPQRHWSEGVSSFDIKAPLTSLNSVQTTDTLDSIDDFPPPESKSRIQTSGLDEIDDFDALSESGGSEVKESQDSYGFGKNSLSVKMSLDLAKLDIMSRSSSKSDMSEGLKSDLSSDFASKPLKNGNIYGSVGSQKTKSVQMFDKAGSDSSWSKFSRDESGEIDTPECIRDRIRKAGDDFIKNVDDQFVTELAESVVEKLYEGKNVSDRDRAAMLKRVCSDIWRDFERCGAPPRPEASSSPWANTPASGANNPTTGTDYSKNMGTFATDYMKRHYNNTERQSISPKPSNVSVVHPQKQSPPPMSLSPFLDNSNFTPPLPWPDEKRPSTDLPVTSAFPLSSSSGYNLFSGPTWGLDTLSTSTTHIAPIAPPQKSVPAAAQAPAHTPTTFIRPPVAVSSFYQRPNMPMPFHPNVPPRMPMPPLPHMRMPFPPQPLTSPVEKKDKETQVLPYTTDTGTMTDVYEPYKEEYLKIKEHRDEALRVMAESKTLYDKLVHEHKAREQELQVLKADITNKVGMYELEKKSWKNEREAFGVEIKRLQEQLRARDSQERELKEMMQGQEKQVQELAVLAKQQREKDITEIQKVLEQSEKYRQATDAQKNRAQTAEIEILKSKLYMAKNILECSQKEASFHQQRLTAVIQKHEEEKKSVPPALQQGVDFWTSVLSKSEENIHKIEADYEEQIGQIRSGKQLMELDPITIPSPPPVPDAIRSMPFMQPGFMMPRVPFSNRPPFKHPGMPNVPSSIGPGTASLSAITAPYTNGQPKSSVENHSHTSLPTIQPSDVGFSRAPGPSSQVSYSTSAPPLIQTTPRPLTTLAAASGLAKLGPLSTPRAPLSVPNRPPLRPIGTGGIPTQMTSFEKLVLKLKLTFPEKSRAEVSQLIQNLRQRRGGSLSGMTMEDIIQQITEIIESPSIPASTGDPSAITSKPVGPPPGLSSSWAFKVSESAQGNKLEQGRGSSSELYQEEEIDPCVICHEDMGQQCAVTLECGHLFHDECIRKWFQEQSTCPNCRVHTLLSDEFPSLG